MIITRRHLLRLGGATALLGGTQAVTWAQSRPGQPQTAARSAARDTAGPADHTLRIATSLIELGPDTTVSTKTYNGQFPGPLLRLTEGKRVVIDVHNDTDTPELLH